MLLSFLYKDFPVRNPQHSVASYSASRINAIHLLHLLSIVFIYTGWLLPAPVPLGIYLVYVGATILSWWLNADLCPMTETEYRWRHWNPATTPGFTQMFLIRPLLSAWGKSGASQETRLADAVVKSIYLFFLIALVRFLLYFIA